MKKTILILVAAILCLSMTSCAGCNVGGASTTTASKATTTTVATTNATTAITTTQSTIANTLSEESNNLLQKYPEVAIEGLVSGMSWSDVESICGDLKETTKYGFMGNALYEYKNLVLIRELDEDGSNGDLLQIAVLKGNYVGLTIGKSTKEDADKIFGAEEYDSFEKGTAFNENIEIDDSNYEKYTCSIYNSRFNKRIDIVVFYTDGVVSEIVSEINRY